MHILNQINNLKNLYTQVSGGYEIDEVPQADLNNYYPYYIRIESLEKKLD